MTSRASLVRQRVQAATTRYLLKTFDRDLQSTVVVPKATKKRNGMITVPIQYGMDLLRVNITRLNVLGFNERAWEKDSLYTGLGCGRLTFDANGRLVKGLGARRIAMVNYLLNTRFCVFEVRKYPGGFICCYPHAYGYVLVERLRKMAGVAGIAERGDIRRRRLTVGRFRVEVLEYDGIFDFKVDPETFLNLLRLKDARLRGAFMAISEPAVFVAFDRVFYVRRRYQRGLNDEILEMNPMTAERLLGRFEIVRKDFLAGKRRRAEKAHAPRVYSTVPRTRFPDLEGAMPDADWIRQREAGIPRSNKTVAVQDVRLQRFLDYVCDFLRGAVDPSPVRKVVNGVAYAGEISAPDSLIYPPIWTVDHFMNAMGLIPFDLSASMRLCEGGLIAYMKMDDPHKGLIPLKATPETTSTSSFPLWAPACWWNYLHSGGRGFLARVFPLLRMNDEWWDRERRSDDGTYRERLFWNDYSCGAKRQEGVVSIALNSLLCLQKQVLGLIGNELGVPNDYLSQAARLRDITNRLFWDDREGFYYDYDSRKKRTYRTPRGTAYYSLDNLVPLLARIPSREQARRMYAKLCDTRLYGKYPAITTELSDTFIDGRGLMVWGMANWLILLGLRNYGFDAKADQISNEILNACYQNWLTKRSIPEALCARHGLDSEENANLAGVGCVTAIPLLFWDLLGVRYVNDGTSIDFDCRENRSRLAIRVEAFICRKGVRIEFARHCGS